ncbi:septal ring factor EnvC (AmiA/AmiB activator) [Sphingomonas zeicaulis]|uniref:murein hydrolase activator EnvC family protein n=1 Tax=Sphingomonas zeicaulis TaxID=1632740 RepID=UPI003D22E366
MGRRHVPLFVVFALLGCGFALAAANPDLAEQRRAVAEAKRQSALATARARSLQQQAAGESDAATKADAEAAAAAARAQAAEADVAAADARIAIVATLQARQRTRLAAREAPIARLTAALQTMARRPPALALAQPGAAADLVHVRMLLGSLLPVVRQRTGGLRAEVAAGRRLRLAADRAAVDRRAGHARIAEEQRTLARLADQHRLRSRMLATGAMLEQDRAMALGEKARDLVDLMRRIEEDALVRRRLEALPAPMPCPARPGAVPLPAAAPAASVAQGRLAYRLPVVGRLVTGLGDLSAGGVRSRGLSFATRPGAQVVAPAAGHVVYAGRYRGFDGILIIDHGGGWMTLLANLATLRARVGDNLVAGAPVGRGGGGQALVTVELRRDGAPVDIAPLVSGG